MMDSKHKSDSKKALPFSGDEAIQFGGTGFVDRRAKEPLKTGTEIMGSSFQETGPWRSESQKSNAASKDNAAGEHGIHEVNVRAGLPLGGGMGKESSTGVNTEREISDVTPVSLRNEVIPRHKVKPVISEESKAYLKMLLSAKNRDTLHIYDEKLKAFTQRKKS